MFNKIINLILCIICFTLLTTSCRTSGNSSLSTLVETSEDGIYLYYAAEARDGTPVVCRYTCKEVPTKETINSLCNNLEYYIPQSLLYKTFNDKHSLEAFKEIIESDLLLTTKDFKTKTRVNVRLSIVDGKTVVVPEQTHLVNINELNELYLNYWRNITEVEYRMLGNPVVVCQDPKVRVYKSPLDY